MVTKNITPIDVAPEHKSGLGRAVLGAVLIAAIVATGFSIAKHGSAKAGAAKTSASKAVTLTGYLSAGNKICATMNSANKALGPFPSTLAGEATHMRNLLAVSTHALTRLEALPKPTEQAPDLSRVLADFAQLNTLGASAEQAMASGDGALAGARLDALASQSGRVNAELNEVGLTVCGN